MGCLVSRPNRGEEAEAFVAILLKVFPADRIVRQRWDFSLEAVSIKGNITKDDQIALYKAVLAEYSTPRDRKWFLGLVQDLWVRSGVSVSQIQEIVRMHDVRKNRWWNRLRARF